MINMTFIRTPCYVVALMSLFSSSSSYFQNDAPALSSFSIVGNFLEKGCTYRNTSLTFNSIKNMTLNSCAESCSTQGYRYAGVYNGDKCHCGKELIVCSKESSTTNSNVRCAGDGNQFCGSLISITILDTDDAARQSFKHVGCYKDNAQARDLSFLALNSSTMTLQLCTTTCLSHDYRYAGVQEGNRCYCGQTFGKYGVFPADKQGCGSLCLGEKHIVCGDKNANTITDNGLWTNPSKKLYGMVRRYYAPYVGYMSQNAFQTLPVNKAFDAIQRITFCRTSCFSKPACSSVNIRARTPVNTTGTEYTCELLRTPYWKKGSMKNEADAEYWQIYLP